MRAGGTISALPHPATSGVRGRLLAAFLVLWLFVVAAAAAAVYTFSRMGGALDRITEERLPATLTLEELGRRAERLAAAAPALLTVTDGAQQTTTHAAVSEELRLLKRHIDRLRGGRLEADTLHEISGLVTAIEENLDGLNAAIGERLAVSARKKARLNELGRTNVALQRVLTPASVLLESHSAQLQRQLDARASLPGEVARLATAVTHLLPIQKALVAASKAHDKLLEISEEPSAPSLAMHRFPLERALDTLDSAAVQLSGDAQAEFRRQVAALRGFVDGAQSIVALRARELGLIARARGLLEENGRQSRALSERAAALAAAAGVEI